MPNQFDGYETLNIGGEGLTIRTLEFLINIANEHGRVAIINMGQTSLLDLALSLLAYAKKHEEKYASTPD